MSSSEPSIPICTIDPYSVLRCSPNSDGTLTRLVENPLTPASSDPNSPSPVLTKDFSLHPTHNTFVRVFLPKIALNSTSSSSKLPIIVYIHGGGFVVYHANSDVFHDFCSQAAAHTAAIFVSVEHRLAPEHRLPAAYDDTMDAIHWIRASATSDESEWIYKYGDVSRCFLMGSSAGGNIAYHAGLQAATLALDLEPLKIKGLILHQPYFGGSGRTGSQIRLVNDPVVPLSASDLCWELALPVGSDRDHEYSNPRSGSGPGLLGRVKELGWRVLVTGCSGDPLVDHQMELVKLLEEKGVDVKGCFSEGDCHGVEFFDPAKCSSFFVLVKDFVSSCMVA